MSTDARKFEQHNGDVVTHRSLGPRRDIAGGLLTLTYVVGLPFVVLRLWPLQFHLHHLGELRAVFGALVVLWIWLLVRIAVDVAHRKSSRRSVYAGGAVGWIAALIVVALSFLPSLAGAASRVATITPTPGSYVVAPGDSLWSIAQQQLGNGNEWSRIYELNRIDGPSHTSLTNPDIIRPGWTLLLPEPAMPFADVSGRTSTPPSTAATISPTSVNHASNDVRVGLNRPPSDPLGGLSVSSAASLSANSPSPRHDTDRSLRSPRAPWGLSTLGALPFAMVAKRRRDFLLQSRLEPDDDIADQLIDELRLFDVDEINFVGASLGTEHDGVVVIGRREPTERWTNVDDDVLAVVLGSSDNDVLVSFARPGGTLSLSSSYASALLTNAAVALHPDGTFRIATSERDVLRELALRSSPRTMVVYTGEPDDLDVDVADLCVCLSPSPVDLDQTFVYEQRKWSLLPTISLADPSTSTRTSRPAVYDNAGVVVSLLQANPTISGLVEPFEPTLRRRCLEMTAYLAMHRHEPVTGERLRARVLNKGSDEASLRLLSNTSTAVRRSLGVEGGQPRLHHVTAAGLYETHDVGSDLERFHALVHLARSDETVSLVETLTKALDLVRGEPLACSLRGFEWFLAEGYLARLQRDSEWAALALAYEASANQDFNLAFWAIERGLLCDPHNEELLAQLHQVPRLRQFGGDGPGRTKNASVGAERSVVMSWSFEGLGDEVTQ